MFNPCTEAKQIKYQQIQEDVGGVSVLLGLKKKNPWSAQKSRKGSEDSVNLMGGVNGSSEFSRRPGNLRNLSIQASGMHAGSETAALGIP